MNGKIQPFFQVQPRRYRFRLLDTGPSRFYQYFLTDLNNLGANNTFWVIANDGNLLPAPVQVSSVRIGPAERVDIIIDFSQFAGKTIYLENRLKQLNGQGPVDDFGPNSTSENALRCSARRRRRSWRPGRAICCCSSASARRPSTTTVCRRANRRSISCRAPRSTRGSYAPSSSTA